MNVREPVFLREGPGGSEDLLWDQYESRYLTEGNRQRLVNELTELISEETGIKGKAPLAVLRTSLYNWCFSVLSAQEELEAMYNRGVITETFDDFCAPDFD